MTRYLCLKASEFEDLLMLFADDVAAKVWNKMPYDKWKGFLKKLDSKDYPFVGIDFGETEVLITFIDHSGDSYDTQIFHKGDKTFGDFLFREYAEQMIQAVVSFFSLLNYQYHYFFGRLRMIPITLALPNLT